MKNTKELCDYLTNALGQQMLLLPVDDAPEGKFGYLLCSQSASTNEIAIFISRSVFKNITRQEVTGNTFILEYEKAKNEDRPIYNGMEPKDMRLGFVVQYHKHAVHYVCSLKEMKNWKSEWLMVQDEITALQDHL